MSKSSRIQSLWKKEIIILDGATGTELQKKGMPAGVCPELWCLENPSIIKDIHASYQLAGAQIVYSCTFGANRFKLEQYGNKGNTYSINRDLVRLAKQAVGKKGLVAGDIGPTGLFIEPFGSLAFEEAVDAFKEQVRGLIDGGCDLIVIETMIDIQETRAALLAVKEIKDIFTIVCMTYEEDGHTLNGTDPISALITLQSLGADAVGCNCSTGPGKMMEFISLMKPFATVPLIAKPNAGVPRLENGKTVFDMDAPVFGSFGRGLMEAGANMIGGCCGTTPAHIQELAKVLKGNKPELPVRKSIGAVSSSRGNLIFEGNNPLYIVGERINPTGKKALQQELLEGKTSIIRQMAVEQEKQGAHLLDVNVGQPGIDEVITIKSIIGLLTTVTKLPLVVDSSKIETIEAALRFYPGRMLINSISGEKEKMAKLLPLAAKYGAMFILLPLTDGNIPLTAEKRQTVIKNIYSEVRKYGFTKDDFIVDGLVMAVASDSGAAQETLKTLRWCQEIFHSKTILGLSNVSFGMPGRPWLNAAFLAMAQLNGLTAAIANPASLEFMNIKKAGDVLAAKEKSAQKFIEHFSDKQSVVPQAAAIEILSPQDKVTAAIMDGNRENITSLIEAVLAAGITAAALVDNVMIPAIVRVGLLYEKKVYFLPQLMASAETMKKALGYLEPHLRKSASATKGKILIATVKGDIHDIGKNIVALLLRNYGYNVVDLGKDISAAEIIGAAKKENPDVIGLSALMTTTMVNMKEVIDTARAEGLRTSFLLGGAVVTEDYAHSIGAAYARDGVEAVRVVEKIINR
ncbi:MAG: 5-methyltetrahydrofolate--homocysteine methyltransferase [Deltaproteobacteria bacterium HGW-Deltaproteobacteria-10]|nr:MAG: 5-methyltetrahydrofolate--homocysteine methyltransferase [Deltaproteobacteria bacterium HGW-Deltaproteobacteria-10]